MAYATVAELRSELKLSAVETADDARLTTCLERAQGFIESPECCNRVFEASADSTRYLDLTRVRDDGLTLRLDFDLAATPTTVTNGDGEVIPSTAYILLERNVTPYHSIRLKRSSGYLWSYGDDPDNPITILGKCAYSTAAPTNIKTATLVLAKWLYQQKMSNSNTDQPIMSPGGFVIMPSRLPTVFWDLVRAFQRR